MRTQLLACGLVLALAGCSWAAEPAATPARELPMPRLSPANTISACLARHPGLVDAETCIGQYVEACLTLAPDRDTAGGQLACYRDERAAWAQRRPATGGAPDATECEPLLDDPLRHADCTMRLEAREALEWLGHLDGGLR